MNKPLSGSNGTVHSRRMHAALPAPQECTLRRSLIVHFGKKLRAFLRAYPAVSRLNPFAAVRGVADDG
jgi:hypothetical protein